MKKILKKLPNVLIENNFYYLLYHKNIQQMPLEDQILFLTLRFHPLDGTAFSFIKLLISTLFSKNEK